MYIFKLRKVEKSGLASSFFVCAFVCRKRYSVKMFDTYIPSNAVIMLKCHNRNNKVQAVNTTCGHVTATINCLTTFSFAMASFHKAEVNLKLVT